MIKGRRGPGAPGTPATGLLQAGENPAAGHLYARIERARRWLTGLLTTADVPVTVRSSIREAIACLDADSPRPEGEAMSDTNVGRGMAPCRTGCMCLDCQLERANTKLKAKDAENAALREALQAIVDLDDGDKPDLWHFQPEFDAARRVLAALAAARKP